MLRQKLSATATSLQAVRGEVGGLAGELQQARSRLRSTREENYQAARDLEKEKSLVQNLRLQFESGQAAFFVNIENLVNFGQHTVVIESWWQTTMGILETENEELSRALQCKARH